MHEHAVVSALLARVEELVDERDARGVAGVWVRIGELSGVDPATLVSAFHSVREETACEKAELHVTWCPVRWVCRDCGAEIVNAGGLACAGCGGLGRLESGDEIQLERVELSEG